MFFMNKYEKITIYSAETSRHSLLTHLRDIMRAFPQSHELGFRLFSRNITALYRQSLLGFAWALLPPLATAALWIFLRGNNVVRMEETGVSYPIFVLTGTMLWQVFSEAISAPLIQTTENKAVLSKVNIPHEGLLLSGLYQLLFNIGIKVLLLVVVLIAFREEFIFSSFVFVPVGLCAISLAGFSIGLLITPIGMLYQDINRGLAIILPFLMYLTPTVYPAPRDGFVGLIMRINPIAVFITETRSWLTAQPVYDMPLFWLYLVVFFFLLLIAIIIYRLSMPIIIERIGS
jgi:lipopolysaccharide transport system permease protein